MNEASDNGKPAPELLYRLRGLTKRYPSGDTEVRAVDGIDLNVVAGEFAVVAGPSGSGKSTMLQMLGALDRPSEGSIEFEGRDLAHHSDSELADLRRDRIGFVFQQFNLIPTLTAGENVELAMAPASRVAAQREGRVRDLLDRVGLGARAEHLPSQLSGGEQQRVAIARALANGPDVLLADEPTGNLDTTTGDAIVDLLYRLWEETGLTVVLVTHDPAVAGASPRLIRLADGRIADEQGGERAPVATEASGR